MKLLKTVNAVNTVAIQEENMEKGILIVDDSKFSRNILKDILKNEGFHVIAEAKNGIEAIEMTKQKKPQYIFMDVEMPMLDGLGAIPRILEVDPFVHIIMCTAMGQKNIIVEAARAGAKDYVLKPYKKENIIRVLSVYRENQQKDGQIIPFKGGRKYQEEVQEVAAMEEEYPADFTTKEPEYMAKNEYSIDFAAEEPKDLAKNKYSIDFTTQEPEDMAKNEYSIDFAVEETKDIIKEEYPEDLAIDEFMEPLTFEEEYGNNSRELFLEPFDLEEKEVADSEVESLEPPVLEGNLEVDNEALFLEPPILEGNSDGDNEALSLEPLILEEELETDSEELLLETFVLEEELETDSEALLLETFEFERDEAAANEAESEEPLDVNGEVKAPTEDINQEVVILEDRPEVRTEATEQDVDNLEDSQKTLEEGDKLSIQVENDILEILVEDEENAQISTEIVNITEVDNTETHSAEDENAKVDSAEVDSTEVLSTEVDNKEEDDAVAESAIAESTVADNAVAENAIAESTVAENAVAENAVVENVVADNAVVENAIAESIGVENAVVDNAVANNAIAENTVAENAVAENREDENSEADNVESDNTENPVEEKELEAVVIGDNPKALFDGENTQISVLEDNLENQASPDNCQFEYLWENRFDLRPDVSADMPVNQRLSFYNVVQFTSDGYGLSERNNSDKEIISGMISAYLCWGNRLQPEETNYEDKISAATEGTRVFTSKILEEESKDRTDITMEDILKLAGNKEQQTSKVLIQITSLSNAMLHLVQGKADRILGQDYL